MKQDPQQSESQIVEDIAKRHLGIKSLESRDSDGLDFHEIGVRQLRTALEAAYRAGAACAQQHAAIIRATTTYMGDELPGLKGQRVRIFAVLRGALDRSVDRDSDEHYVTDDETLSRLGGVREVDRVDVAFVHADGRASFVHEDVRAIDLEMFKHLRRNADR